jgi:hypothetical protein
MKSIYKQIGGSIVLPEFSGLDLLYMHKTRLDEVKLPDGYKHYEKPIKQMFDNLSDRNNVCYITIDEKILNNQTHRRGGRHVDFNWFEGQGHYGEDIPDSPGGHRAIGNHHGTPPTSPTHRPFISGSWDNSPTEWRRSTDGGVLLISNFEGCRAWDGEYDESLIGEGGDCEKVPVQNLKSEILPANVPFFVNAYGIHESIKIEQMVKRNLIRVNFHPEYKFN